MLVSAVSLFFIRDAVAVRWMLVALGLAALAAFGASLSWQLRFHSADERVGGFSDDVDSMSRLRGQRGSLSARIVFRAIGVLVISLFTLTIGGGGREDAIAVVWLGCGGLLLAPAIGVFALHLSERRSLAALPEQTTFPQSYRPPGPIGTATISIVAILALSLTALGALQLPVLPNGHDADENYTLEMSSGTPSASSSGSDEERCGGRPATRLACLTRKQRERAEQGWGVDVKPIEVPKIDIPEIDSDYSFDLDGDGTAE
jgi:hypothetical protein